MKNDIIEQNLGLVRSCISKFYFKKDEYDDIFQAGCLGLARAAQRFDISRGVKFSTYAVPFILGEIKNFFHDNNNIKIGRNLSKIYSSVKLARRLFYDKNKREPTLNEISSIINTSPESILEAIECNKPVSSIDDDNRSLKINAKSIQKSYDSYIESRVDVQKAIQKLSNLDKKILDMRFFEFKTQQDSAKKLGMTQVQISRREKKILQFLRSNLC